MERKTSALEVFKQNPEQNLTPELDSIISQIAATGLVYFEWSLLRPLLGEKLKKVIIDFNEKAGKGALNETLATPTLADAPSTLQEHIEQLIELLDDFSGAPFTIQRLCELLLNPGRHYRTSQKLLTAFDKLLTVTTTQPVAPFPGNLAGADSS
eukprot:TRINITY_DN16517_c0_g1::TRINITY_DN16517_c0_g1_i1::g.1871::m.1871 TRINITY_DN16517_c0_g1::TRINITY_DN16517_c0_g1_i1::g.1871  ORF type:complete len:154 (-),score=24.09,sp/Q6DCQ0/P4R2B_XENLA/31.88/1e-15,PPP4R2/PF09184.6/1.9e-26 TRINITY_DN16517_c0_g1_i1:710-1171(-)